MKNRYLTGGILAFIILLALLTNPSEEQYLRFSEDRYGTIETPISMEIERINFLVFTAYTPIYFNEHGITHIGAFSTFFQISDGQFDYPMWLEIFN